LYRAKLLWTVGYRIFVRKDGDSLGRTALDHRFSRGPMHAELPWTKKSLCLAALSFCDLLARELDEGRTRNRDYSKNYIALGILMEE